MVNDDLAEVLSEFARTMLTDFPIQGILDRLVERIVDILPITAAGVTLIAPGLQPHYVAASDTSALRYERLQSELGEGPCLAAYVGGEAISVPDLSDEQRFPEFSSRALEAGLRAVFTFPLRHGDGQLGALDLYRTGTGPLSAVVMTAAQTLADVAAAYLINAQARSDLKDSSDQSREAALHDPLTGLPNRALLLQRLEHAFARGRRSNLTSAVFFIDLNRFKEINDTYGHQTGDDLLVAVAQRLTDVLRPGDSLARLSGDEFVILCEDLNDPSQVDSLALRFHAVLGQPFRLSGTEVRMTCSIGIAVAGRETPAPEALIHDADLAMYRQKRNRRGSHDVLDLRELHLAGHHAGLARSLPGAADRGELHVEYQPIVDTADGQIRAVEALLRWSHPARGPISPSVFIPFAEQSGQIIELGAWVLHQAWADREHWQAPRAPDIGVSVNVSPHQFMAAGFAEDVAAILESMPADPGLLTLEVTESVFVRDEQRALVVLDEIKDLGVKLALDDFGTGYSSLGYLNTLPIDAIKVDQTFIARLTHDPHSQRIVTAIIGLAHSLGMTVVSEGVETAKQHYELARLGSDRCQGYYFAQPMPADTVDTLLQRPERGRASLLPLPTHAVPRTTPARPAPAGRTLQVIHTSPASHTPPPSASNACRHPEPDVGRVGEGP
jgi:diguanylate cyclase (GGDEF)-like protein